MNKKSINTQTLFNILSTVLLAGINFYTIPIFTKLLGATQYGLYGVFCSWSAVLVPFLCLESQTSIAVAKYEFKNDYSNYKKNILIFETLITLVIGLVFFLLKDVLADLLGFSSQVVLFIFLYSVSLYIVDFVKSMYIYEKKAINNFLLSLLIALSTAILSYFFIINNSFSEPFEGRAYGVAIPYIIISIISWIVIMFKNKGKINVNYWKFAFIYGFPIVFHILSHDILGQSDRIMLQYLGYAGPTVGIYAFYNSFTSIVMMILNAFNTSWSPFYYDYLNKKDYIQINEKIRNYKELFTVISIGFILLSREVCYFFTSEEYWAGMNIIPLCIISIYLTFMYQFAVNFEFYNKKTKTIAAGTIIAAVLNLILNYLLIPNYGMYGAIIATVLSYLFLLVMHYIIAKRIKEMKFHISIKSFIPNIILLLLSIVSFYVLSNLPIIRWIIGIIIGLYEILKIYKRKSIF